MILIKCIIISCILRRSYREKTNLKTHEKLSKIELFHANPQVIILFLTNLKTIIEIKNIQRGF
jgi:hypothetical protein